MEPKQYSVYRKMESKLTPSKNLDLDFYETVVIYNCLLDPVYMSSIVDYLDVRFFKNKDIRNVITIILNFFKTKLMGLVNK